MVPIVRLSSGELSQLGFREPIIACTLFAGYIGFLGFGTLKKTERNGGKVTLADVAKEAGVSVQTASHVLAENLTVRLPESTRVRVKEAAHKVGYRPNRLAQAMKRGKTNVVSVWMPLDRAVLTYVRYLKLVHDLAKNEGYDVMITGLEASNALVQSGKLPTLWPVDGIIAIDSDKGILTYREDTQNQSTPVVILGLEQVENGDSVSWDLAGAAKSVVQRLIAKGAKRIVHLTPQWVYDGFPREQRRRGYMEAMEEAGLQPELIPVDAETSASTANTVEAYLNEKGCPDAFFGFTDPIAIGAARALFRTGRNIPDDCLVWGFGDFPEGEDYRVPISTIRIPIEAIMGQAWTWLSERMAGNQPDSRLVILPMELIERESSNR